MNGLLIRRTTGMGVILLMASLVILVALPVAAVEGNCTGQDGGWTELATSGAWGTITDNGDGSVSVDLNPGYSLELCVKGGPGYEVYDVSGNGGTYWPPANCGQANLQCGLSHWGIREVVVTTTTTTKGGSTTTTAGSGSTTTTTDGSTTTTTDRSTTTTTADTTTTTSGNTTTTEAATTTTEAATTTSQGATTTAAQTAVLGIQVSAPVTPQVNPVTQATLPFTGVSSGQLAMLASVISAVGMLLLLASRQNEDKVPARSWS